MPSHSDEMFEDPLESAEQYELSIGEVVTEGYVSVSPDTSIESALDTFQKFSPDDPEQTTIYYTYVVDAGDRLQGVASLREMLGADPSARMSEIMTTDLITFRDTADAEQAAITAADLHFPAIPVTDADQRLLGIVRSETLLEVLEQESSDDMLRMQGMDLPELESEDITDIESRRSTLMLDASIWQILRIRVPWLFVALAGGFLAGGVIGIYEATLEAVVLLAFFIPVVMDMGGNVGTQSSTIFIRGVVLGHIDKSNVVKRIGKETIVGGLIGLSVGLVAAVVAYLWLGRADIAYVVFGAMVGTSLVAALVGFLIPWIVYLIGQDPAAASNPIVTTIKDVSGLMIYFGLSSLLVFELVV